MPKLQNVITYMRCVVVTAYMRRYITYMSTYMCQSLSDTVRSITVRIYVIKYVSILAGKISICIGRIYATTFVSNLLGHDIINRRPHICGHIYVYHTLQKYSYYRTAYMRQWVCDLLLAHNRDLRSTYMRCHMHRSWSETITVIDHRTYALTHP